MTPMSREEFADRATEAVAKRYPQARMARLPFGVQLSDPERTLGFDHPYVAYRRNPNRFDDIMAAWLTAVEGEPPPPVPSLVELKDSILPTLNPLSHFELVKSQLLHSGVQDSQLARRMPVMQRLGRSALILYSVARPESIDYVTPEQLSGAGLTPKTLHALAVANLAKHSQAQGLKITAGPTADAGVLYVVEPMDQHNAARLLLGDLLEKIAEAAREDIVLAIPQRDVLFATARSNNRGVMWMRKIANEKFRTAKQPVSGGLFLYQRGPGVIDELG